MATAPRKNGGFLTIFGVLAILHFWDHKIQTIVLEPYLVRHPPEHFCLRKRPS